MHHQSITRQPQQKNPDRVNTAVANVIGITMWLVLIMFNAVSDLPYEQKLLVDLVFFGPLQLLANKAKHELRK